MAQKLKLKINIETKDGVRTLKQLKGSISDLRNDINKFNTEPISKEFKDVGKVIDNVNRKLEKFSKLVGSGDIGMTFRNVGNTTEPTNTRFSSAGGPNNLGHFNEVLRKVSNSLFQTSKLLNQVVSKLQSIIGRSAIGPNASGIAGTGRSSNRGGGNLFGGVGLAIGATAGLIGSQIEALFKDRRVTGKFQTAFSSLFQEVGNILGSTVGSIASDIGSAFGNLGQIAFNSFTLPFRLAGTAIGAFIKGAGAAFVGAVIGSLVGPIGVAVGVVLGAITSLTSVVGEVFNEIFSIIENVFDAAVSVIKAGIKTIAAAFRGVVNVIKSIWVGLWEGIKSITKASIDGLKNIIGTLADTFASLAKKGIEGFIELEAGAAISAKEIVGEFDRNFTPEFERIIANFSSKFGVAINEVKEALFNITSAGLLSNIANPIAKASDILTEASKLAIADNASLDTATNSLIITLSSYGKQLENAAEASRLLAGATTVGVTNLNELGAALPNVIGGASQLGFALKDTLAAVARLTQVFGRGSARNVTRFLNRFFEALSFPTSTVRKDLESMGFVFEDLFNRTDVSSTEKFINLFGQIQKLAEGGVGDPDKFRRFFPTIQSRKAAVGLLSDTEKFRNTLERLDTASDSFSESLLIRFGTLQQRLAIIRQTIANINITTIGKLVGAFLKGTVITTKFTKNLLKIADAINTKVFGARLQAIGDIFADAISPITELLNRGSAKVASFLDSFGQGGNLDFFENLSDKIKPIVQEIANFIEKSLTVNNIINIFTRFVNIIKKATGLVIDLAKAFESDGISGVFREIFDSIPFNVLQERFINSILKGVAVLVTKAPTIFEDLVRVISEQLSKINIDLDLLEEAIKKSFSFILARLNQLFTKFLAEQGVSIIESVIDDLQNADIPILSKLLDDTLNIVQKIVGEFDKIKPLFELFNSTVTKLTGLAIQLAKLGLRGASAIAEGISFIPGLSLDADANKRLGEKAKNAILDRFEGRTAPDVRGKLNEQIEKLRAILPSLQKNLDARALEAARVADIRRKELIDVQRVAIDEFKNSVSDFSSAVKEIVLQATGNADFRGIERTDTSGISTPPVVPIGNSLQIGL